jgi:phage terminase large subunit-like protein
MIAHANPQHDVQDYIDGVLSGEIVVGRLVLLAVQRHVQDLEHAHSRGWKFDKDIATRAVLFFPKCCRHSIGEWDGERFELAPFQKFIIWCLFGWRNIQTGLRRFRKAYLTFARKNGKTTLCSGLALLCMFADEPFEPGAEVYCAATKEDQAKILHREAVRMVQASPALRKRATVRASAPQRISWEDKHSLFRPLGSDKPFDGLNPHCIVLDELHAWREHHRPFHETMNTGSGSRRQPLMAIITTAGDDKSQLWLEEDEFAVKVLESVIDGNIIDDTAFAFVARIDDGDDPFDEKVWPKANPNYGVSVKPEYLRTQANEAKHKPTTTNQFLRYHCNVKVGSSERAISSEMWKKGSQPLTIKQGSEGFGGFDLGRSDDWCAIGAAFPFYRETDEGRAIDHWEVIAKAWCCKDGTFPVAQEPFRSWIRDGLLEVHDGDQVDFSVVERTAVAWSNQYAIRNWAYDPNFASVIAQRLQEEHGLEIYKFIQSHRSYNEPVRTFTRELHAGNIWHGNEPILGWQAGNLTVNRNAKDEWMPDKGNKLHKIDGMVAVLMAFAGTIANIDRPSVYEKRGVLSLGVSESPPTAPNWLDDDEDY